MHGGLADEPRVAARSSVARAHYSGDYFRPDASSSLLERRPRRGGWTESCRFTSGVRRGRLGCLWRRGEATSALTNVRPSRGPRRRRPQLPLRASEASKRQPGFRARSGDRGGATQSNRLPDDRFRKARSTAPTTASADSPTLRHVTSGGLSSINRALNNVPKRAEARQVEQLRQTFVDSGVAAAIESVDHQVLYGRRGTGKTHAFRYLQTVVEDRGDISFYADRRTIGSPEGLFEAEQVDPSQRAGLCTRRSHAPVPRCDLAGGHRRPRADLSTAISSASWTSSPGRR